VAEDESSEVDWTKASQWTLQTVRPQLHGTGMEREEIGYAVRRFIEGDERLVFWGYFPAYDWVAFCWLFGDMNELLFRFPRSRNSAWTSSSGPSSWATPICRSSRALVTTASTTRGGRERRGRSSPASILPQARDAPWAAKTLINSLQSRRDRRVACPRMISSNL
jgi:hypothetical protein